MESSFETRCSKPLGLEHSFFDTEVSRHGEMAQRYDRDGKVFPFYVTSTPGTGELYASAHDVARFAMFHLKDHLADQKQILSDAQIDELHRPVIHVREDRAHGVGWMLGRAFDGTPVVYHTGNQAGVVNVMMLLPSRDIACVVLTNHDDSSRPGRPDPRRGASNVGPGLDVEVLGSLACAAAAADVSRHVARQGARWENEIRCRSVHCRSGIESPGRRAQQPEPISQLSLVDGALVGTTRGKLEFPAANAAQAEGLSLRLQLRGMKLAGEIGTQIPIPRAAVPGYLPFFAELSLSSAPSAASRPAPRASASPAPR